MRHADGGASPAVLHLVTAAVRRGAEVHAVHLDAALADRGWTSRLAALHPGGGGLDVPVLGPRSLGATTLLAVRHLARRADVVVAHGSRTLPAAAVALAGSGTPFVYRSIGDPEAWVVGRAARVRTGAALRRAAAVVALWPAAADRLEAVHGLERSRVAVIPNAVSPPSAPRVPLPPVARVAFVGSLTEEKRPGLALDACHAAGVPVVVAGDGPLRRQLERRAAGRGQEAAFLGTVTDVDAVYDRASVVLLTSRTEGQPAVIAEAAHRGRGCVATSVGGIPAMVVDGVDGVLLPADPSVATVADVLRSALEDADGLGARAAGSIAGRTAMTTAAVAWDDLLRSVRDGGPRPAANDRR